MISVEEAKRIMMERAGVCDTERLELVHAIGRYGAERMLAPVDHPLFDMSAVDGYAFAFGDGAQERVIVANIAAGEVLNRALLPGECARIFTGAAIPQGADTVVMQEFTSIRDQRMTHRDAGLRSGGNVRRQGEQARAGDALLEAGVRSDAAAIGLLASFGIAEVLVSHRPKVSVVVTGNEFMQAGERIPGRIFNSNGAALRSALHGHAQQVQVEAAGDERQLLLEAIQRAEAAADLVITTGGASVGDHDLVEHVLKHLGATIHFHGVAQKPGKPMLFASLNGTPVFGLPGNPRAVMVLFWEYVLPFIRAMQGAKDPWPVSDRLPLTQALTVKGDRAEFRAAQVRGGQVTLLADEGSHMLRSLVDADALAYLPAEKRMWKEGDMIEVHYLPR